MRGALALRLTLALAGVLLLTALLFSLVLEAFTVQSERELREGRYAYVLAELKQRVESPLSLGLQVESLGYLQRLLQRQAEADPDILSIDLFDPAGDQLFTTDAAGIRQAVPESWLREAQALRPPAAEAAPAEALYWSAEEREGRVIGVALFNDFGLLVGGLALRHRVSTPGAALLGPGLWSLVTAAAAAALMGGLGFWWMNRPLDAQAEGLTRALQTAGGPSAIGAGAGLLEPDAARLLLALRKAEQRCALASAEVERIDGLN